MFCRSRAHAFVPDRFSTPPVPFGWEAFWLPRLRDLCLDEVNARARQAGLMLLVSVRCALFQIFSNLVRKNIEGFVQYVESEPDMVKNMIGAYGNTEIALHGGAMLRECVRYESLAQMTLYDETLWLFFDQASTCGAARGVPPTPFSGFLRGRRGGVLVVRRFGVLRRTALQE